MTKALELTLVLLLAFTLSAAEEAKGTEDVREEMTLAGDATVR